ncbi:hypothetical protein JYG23_12415 [Sedimentibacter sp. zth1]|uniref:hypothetical protein n=1 Tax=Sedimentibacter sp. zth1 TaxID=2816908 RepID=UPI001A91AE6B|nr:hypothetical protein [Sedimentibacter sp. zth1]QSX05472.1 hypothetical protein JYG23_12415 [Sedimentibacter sp. zth1]
MKKIIIILGTIVLGVIIVTTMILSDTGLKGSADDITNNAGTTINKMITDISK